MAARSPLRLLAPIALAIALAGVIGVVASSDGGSGDKGHGRTATAPAKSVPHKRFYRVKLGDTLDAISNKTGVPTERLAALNPAVDPQSLQPGTRLKLRP
jgi:LysM repeat protein